MIDDGYPVVDNWEYSFGVRTGSLTLQEIDEERSKGATGLKRYVHWICDCGATSKDPGKKSKRLDNCRNGAMGKKGTRSCGHKQKMMFINPNSSGIIQEDLSGQIINGYKVISKTNIRDSNGSYYYNVECPYCKKIFSLSGRHLKDGYRAKSCGCLNNTTYGLIGEGAGQLKSKSKDEQFIMDVFATYNIPYTKEKQFLDLKSDDGGFLSYDFYLESPKYGKYIIEFDGVQHFKELTGSWKRPLEIQRKYDLRKNKYAWDHNIRLIRISAYDIYDYKDLSIATTRYELTPENEKEYYKLRDSA